VLRESTEITTPPWNLKPRVVVPLANSEKGVEEEEGGGGDRRGVRYSGAGRRGETWERVAAREVCARVSVRT